MSDLRARTQAESLTAALAERWPQATSGVPAHADPWRLLVCAIAARAPGIASLARAWRIIPECAMHAIAHADPRDLWTAWHATGIDAGSLRAVIEAARAIESHHGGAVPDTSVVLARVPGVGVDTALVVTAERDGISAIASDDRLRRVAMRWGWLRTDATRSVTRAVLAERVPLRDRVRFAHRVHALADAYCKRAHPRCAQCPCAAHCPRQGVGAHAV